MSQERLDLLEKYIEIGGCNLLIPGVPSVVFENSIILKANIDKKELNGHYEEMTFCPPTWYKELIDKSKESYTILIIDNINEVDEDEQVKFIEILKYKKIATFELPKNCLVIVTCLDLNTRKINDEVYSLLVQI